MNICRFCLNNFKMDMTEISATLHKLRSFTFLEIAVNPDLPMKVCIHCKMKVDDFADLYYKIVENEMKLKKCLDEGHENLKNFYSNIMSNNVKIEYHDTCFTNDNKENALNTQLVDEFKLNIDNLLVDIKDTDFLASEKHLDYSSDENISLSKVKAKNIQNLGSDRKLKMKNKKRNKSRIANLEIEPDEVKASENDVKIVNFENQKIWKCLTCSECFGSRSTLLKHYKKEHGCQDNEKSSDTENSFKTCIENDCISYQCLKCDKKYDQKRLITRHTISHIENRPYICHTCGRTYKTASEIVRHGRAHDNIKTLSCNESQCGYTTSYIGALKAHEKRHCSDYKYKCEKCGKGFQVKTWYDQHQNVHSGERPFSCEVCGRTFTMHRYLKTHCSTVHPPASDVKRHICMVCGVSCDTRYALKTHLKKHGIANSFLCDMCGKNLSTADHLRLHKRMHLGIKPFTCSTCGKAFVKKCNLQLHKRVHSGEKPFACSYCGKAFSQKSTLVIHVRYHTGSRPYKCENCSKSFVCQGLLSTHQKGCP